MIPCRSHGAAAGATAAADPCLRRCRSDLASSPAASRTLRYSSGCHFDFRGQVRCISSVVGTVAPSRAITPSKRDRGLDRARVSLSYVLAIPALVGDAKFLVAYRPSERAFDAIMRHCPQERCNAPVITSLRRSPYSQGYSGRVARYTRRGNSIGDRALPALTHVFYINSIKAGRIGLRPVTGSDRL
jgi:hypothetical protein